MSAATLKRRQSLAVAGKPAGLLRRGSSMGDIRPAQSPLAEYGVASITLLYSVKYLVRGMFVDILH